MRSTVLYGTEDIVGVVPSLSHQYLSRHFCEASTADLQAKSRFVPGPIQTLQPVVEELNPSVVALL